MDIHQTPVVSPKKEISPVLATMSPHGPNSIYTSLCEQRKCHVNAALSKQLENICVPCVLAVIRNEDAAHEEHAEYARKHLSVLKRTATGMEGPEKSKENDVDEGFGRGLCLDLSTNFVGKNGLIPAVEMATMTPVFTYLNLSNNFVDSTTATKLTTVLDGCPHIRGLDLSKNPIGQQGARSLQLFVSNNPNIAEIVLDGTAITDAKKRMIEAAVLKNRELSAEKLANELERHRKLRQDRLQFQQRRQEKAQREIARMKEDEEDTLDEEERKDVVNELLEDRPLSIVFAFSERSGTKLNALATLRAAYNDERGTDDLGSNVSSRQSHIGIPSSTMSTPSKE